MFTVPLWAGDQPANPAPTPNLATPDTPEARRAYKINVLELAIAEDKAAIASPGGGKLTEVQDKVKIAKKNLKINQEVLAKVKSGADMEVYFCSLCGREYMKSGTCPHCKQPLTSLFTPGAKRPPINPTM
jgi:rubrerythrin